MLGQKSFFNPIDNLVSKNQPYRKFVKLLSFKELVTPLSDLENTEVGRHGYGIESGFKMLLLQYMEDISDRELERYLEENIAAKWFCGFDLESQTPDFSYFSKLRRKIGTDCIKPAQITLAKKGCHNATIKMNHMQGKDFRKDRWLSGCRAPYERVFSKTSHKARYRGIVKNPFMGFMQALCHNLKRLVVLEIETLELVPLTG